MGPNVRRLFHRSSAALRTPQERALVQAVRQARDRDLLGQRAREAEADVARRIAAVRDDPEDPFRNRSDEAIAAELLRRLGGGDNDS